MSNYYNKTMPYHIIYIYILYYIKNLFQNDIETDQKNCQ